MKRFSFSFILFIYLFFLIFAELTFVLLQLEHRLSLMDPSKVMMMMVTMVMMMMMMMMMTVMMIMIMMMTITGANVKSDYMLIHLANCGEVTEQIDDEISRFLLIFGLI